MSDRCPPEPSLLELAGLLDESEAAAFEDAIETADAEYEADLDALVDAFE